MNHRTTLVAASAAAALVVGTASTVSAGDGDRGPARSTAGATAPASPVGHAGHEHRPDDHGAITSSAGTSRRASFDLVRTVVRRRGADLVFVERVEARAGADVPDRTGAFAGAQVLSYVWPTTLDPEAVGFASGTGVLALAATSHPDFDDTPLYDENADGATDNDGRDWHAHWVVLVPDPTRGDGALKVRDIPAGDLPRLPETWPGAPVFLDSPDYRTVVGGDTVRIRLPLRDVGGSTRFRYDGVTAALRVNADLHDPLLRVTTAFDVASGELSLPGTVVRR